MTVTAWADLQADINRPRVEGPSHHEPKWICNQVRELYPIGAVAAALGRSACTVRRWEREGVLPPAPFRADSDSEHGRRRLYTTDWIDRALTAAGIAGVLNERRSDSSRNRLAVLMRDLTACH